MKKENPDSNVRITRNKVALYLQSFVIDGQGNPLAVTLVRDPAAASRLPQSIQKQAATMLNAWLGMSTCTDVIAAVDRRGKNERRKSK